MELEFIINNMKMGFLSFFRPKNRMEKKGLRKISTLYFQCVTWFWHLTSCPPAELVSIRTWTEQIY